MVAFIIASNNSNCCNMQSCSKSLSKIVVQNQLLVSTWIVTLYLVLVYYKIYCQMCVSVCHCDHHNIVRNCLQKKKLFKRDTTATTSQTTFIKNICWCIFMKSNRMMSLPVMNVMMRGK